MLSPRTFFEAIGRFDPYNQDFLQDIGAFQIGFGAVLLAGRDESSWRRTLAIALLARA